MSEPYDLIRCLRALARAENDDLTVANEAADEPEKTRLYLDFWESVHPSDYERVYRELDTWETFPSPGEIMLKDTHDHYPSGWFKATGPLPDGWYWWRKDANDAYPRPTKVYGGIIGNLGELCGPIPEPPEK